MSLIRQAMIFAILGAMFLGIVAVNGQEDPTSCLPDGSYCTLDSKCCNGWCKSWQCTNPNEPEPTPIEPQPKPIEPEPPCLPDGSYCTLDGKCCSGWCKSWQCTNPNEPEPTPIEPQPTPIEPQPKPIEPEPPCLPDGSYCTLDGKCCSGWCKSWQCTSLPGSKVFKLWVGDKDSKNLPGAEVFIDGVSKGITDNKGEVRTEVTFGKHTVSAKASCGETSKEYDFSDNIDGATLYIDSCPAESNNIKTFKLWVGDKDSKNLPGAEVFIDGVSKGKTNSKGEVLTEVTFGKHTVSAKASCGEASKKYDFSNSIDGATLYIDSCPAEQKKIFKIWVGNKYSKNLAGVEVNIDGVNKGITDSKGEVRTEVTFGEHNVWATSSCGWANKVYKFSKDIDGVTLYINSCG
jgi:hypothetical protein